MCLYVHVDSTFSRSAVRKRNTMDTIACHTEHAHTTDLETVALLAGLFVGIVVMFVTCVVHFYPRAPAKKVKQAE